MPKRDPYTVTVAALGRSNPKRMAIDIQQEHAHPAPGTLSTAERAWFGVFFWAIGAFALFAAAADIVDYTSRLVPTCSTPRTSAIRPKAASASRSCGGWSCSAA